MIDVLSLDQVLKVRSLFYSEEVFLNYLTDRSIHNFINELIAEDDIGKNFYYDLHLPQNNVECELKVKSDLVLSGLPFFIGAFKYLDPTINWSEIMKYEGKKFTKGETFLYQFRMPFNVAITMERIALNLLHQSSSISTTTNKFVEKAAKYNIKILDTRKTTPGLRSLQKYAVRVGGGFNHRFGQVDTFMIKDNHKAYFGGLKQAFDFFQSQGVYYNNIIAEIHDLEELKLALDLGLQYLMLDNFAIKDIERAILLKLPLVNYELSGGINLDNLDSYLIQGVDAISVGSLTSWPQKVDLSLKIKRS